MFQDFNTFDYYDVLNAVYDGEVVKIFVDEWNMMSQGKPIVASASVVQDISIEDLRIMWGQFAKLRCRLTPENNGLLLSIEYAERDIWIAEHEEVITIMYHDEY